MVELASILPVLTSGHLSYFTRLVAMYMQLLHAECHAPAQWTLAIEQGEPAAL